MSFEEELLETVGFNKNRDMDSPIKSLKTRILVCQKKMQGLRSMMVRSHMIQSEKVKEYLQLNDELKKLKDKEAAMTYLRNQL